MNTVWTRAATQVDVTGAERLPEHLEFNLQLRHAPTGLRQELIIRYMGTPNTESSRT
jgi:hypothetical protein